LSALTPAENEQMRIEMNTFKADTLAPLAKRYENQVFKNVHGGYLDGYWFR